jgi:hypothetical protein
MVLGLREYSWLVANADTTDKRAKLEVETITNLAIVTKRNIIEHTRRAGWDLYHRHLQGPSLLSEPWK